MRTYHKQVDPKDLVPADDNPQRMDKETYQALKAALAADGDTIDEPAVWKHGKRLRIISGHHRVKVAIDLGWPSLSVKIYDDPACDELWYRRRVLSVNKTHGEPEEDRVRAFLQTTAQLGAIAYPDFDLQSFMVDSGYSGDEIQAYLDAPPVTDLGHYTGKIKAPIYEPKGDRPAVTELVDLTKANQLLEQIEAVDVPDEVRGFLRLAAGRHRVFNYEKIAEYYAHAPAEVQALMENSALVIIDFGKAIENGFVALSGELAEAYAGGK